MKPSKETTDAAWKRYATDRSIETRNELIGLYGHLIQIHAVKLSQRLSVQVSVDEVASAAFDGLLAAIETFVLERGVKFETYAAKRISGAVLDWLRATDPQSRAVRDFERRRASAVVTASSDAGCRASDEEVADRMGMSRVDYDRYLRRSRRGMCVSLGALTSRSGETRDPDVNDTDVHAPHEPEPSDKIQREMVKDFLCRGLQQTERGVMVLYYFEELTMVEVGAVLGLSESRVSQIHRAVLEKLRHRFPTAHSLVAV